MTLAWILAAITVWVVSGVAAAGLARRPQAATVGAGGAVLGGAIGLVAVIRGLAVGTVESLQRPWNIPLGSLALGLDPLSAFFLMPVFLLTALAALYGREYLGAGHPRRNQGAHWLFYNLLAAGMAGVMLARNGVLFLVAWEIMSVASFFLVTYEHKRTAVREAGWTYLVATHLGTAFLLVLFLLLGGPSGSLDFKTPGAPEHAGALFLLAVAGFGTKAGFVPLHVWLPEAHPAAPSHISAIMSGVMIKTGIYGLLRVLTLLGAPSAWWGYLLLAIGLSSGVLGAVFALAQDDLKRLLAYSSVENMGIIALGLGLGVLGVRAHAAALTVLGFGGALLHVLNHSLFKSLLFLGAGSVLHAAGGRLDRLGGLLGRMPWTGVMFIVGAAAICGLPPLNGFVGEFLIYLAALTGGAARGNAAGGLLLIGAAGLALIGGLAAACFTRACGCVFLGAPRSQAAAQAREARPAMLLPMGVLAAACIALGLAGSAVFRGLAPVIAALSADTLPAIRAESAAAARWLGMTAWASAGLAGMVLAVGLFRHLRLARHQRIQGVTWDCGYARPTSRMQYTASSFAQPLVEAFRLILRPRRVLDSPRGVFPEHAALRTETPDVFRTGFFDPLFRRAARMLGALRWLQHGRVQLYVLYITAALLALLVWKLR